MIAVGDFGRGVSGGNLTERQERDFELRARILRIAKHYAPCERQSALRATVVMIAALFSGPDEGEIARMTRMDGYASFWTSGSRKEF